MPAVDNLPCLSHWDTINELSIAQAALLLAGIDPYDYMDGDDDGGLGNIKRCGHERWKMAWGFSDGIVSAIRNKHLKPIQCAIKEWVTWDGGYWSSCIVDDFGSFENTVCKRTTLINRESLLTWVTEAGIDCVYSPPRQDIDLPLPEHLFSPSSISIDGAECVTSHKQQDHKSEGLDFLEAAKIEFWSTYDEDEPCTAPLKKEVIDYLVGIGATKNMAEAIDLILRPFALKVMGRRAAKA